METKRLQEIAEVDPAMSVGLKRKRVLTSFSSPVKKLEVLGY